MLAHAGITAVAGTTRSKEITVRRDRVRPKLYGLTMNAPPHQRFGLAAHRAMLANVNQGLGEPRLNRFNAFSAWFAVFNYN